jgi:hypothetical protein
MLFVVIYLRILVSKTISISDDVYLITMPTCSSFCHMSHHASTYYKAGASERSDFNQIEMVFVSSNSTLTGATTGTGAAY